MSYHIKIITYLIPKYAREGVPVDLQDSANLKSTILIHIHAANVMHNFEMKKSVLPIHPYIISVTHCI